MGLERSGYDFEVIKTAIFRLIITYASLEIILKQFSSCKTSLKFTIYSSTMYTRTLCIIIWFVDWLAHKNVELLQTQFVYLFLSFFPFTFFKSICFCQQLSGVFDPTSDYIIQLFLADVAAIVLNGLIVGYHLIVVALVVVMMNFAYLDCYQPNSNPMLNHQNLMDLCHRCY